MIAVETMVPCVSFAANCNLDWAAISALGGWAAAIATFAAVYVPARNYRKDNERREKRDRQVAFIEVNRLIPKIVDVRGQARTIRSSVLPSIPKVIAGGAKVAMVCSLLRVKGSIPFAILSDGFEMISIGVTNLQSALDVLESFLEDASEIEMYENHPFHKLGDYEVALVNIEDAANNLLTAIERLTNIDVSAFNGAKG